MKTTFAWILGIAATLTIWTVLSALGNQLGIESRIDLGETVLITHGSGRGSYDEEVDSVTTSYGSYSAALGIAVGCWVGFSISALRWDAGFTHKELSTYLAWTIGIAILLVLSGLTHLAFVSFHGGAADSIRWLLEVAVLAGVGWSMHQWWKSRTRHDGDR